VSPSIGRGRPLEGNGVAVGAVSPSQRLEPGAIVFGARASRSRGEVVLTLGLACLSWPRHLKARVVVFRATASVSRWGCCLEGSGVIFEMTVPSSRQVRRSGGGRRFQVGNIVLEATAPSSKRVHRFEVGTVVFGATTPSWGSGHCLHAEGVVPKRGGAPF
jgi:hypothetical protein